jgi:glycine/sarcosine N-methyltransferase
VDFYDAIAGEYDTIVDDDARRDSARRLAGWLVESLGAQRVLDVACGTGLHVRALSERGVDVVAADASEAMLRQARAHDAEGRVAWVHSPMQEIAEQVRGPFDAILCLGNSLPHLLTDAELQAALRGFASLLAPGGAALIQLLNYDRILARRERIVGITRRGDTQYIRFYDFLPNRLRFNLLEVSWRGEQADHRLHQTELRPFRSGELCDALRIAGFAPPAMYDGPSLGAFDSEASEGLLLVARLPE